MICKLFTNDERGATEFAEAHSKTFMLRWQVDDDDYILSLFDEDKDRIYDLICDLQHSLKNEAVSAKRMVP